MQSTKQLPARATGRAPLSMAATNGDANAGASTSNGNGAWSDEHASVLSFIGAIILRSRPLCALELAS